MDLRTLAPNTELTAFDCGDSDLNDFLLQDAKKALEDFHFFVIFSYNLNRHSRRASSLAKG